MGVRWGTKSAIGLAILFIFSLAHRLYLLTTHCWNLLVWGWQLAYFGWYCSCSGVWRPTILFLDAIKNVKTIRSLFIAVCKPCRVCNSGTQVNCNTAVEVKRLPTIPMRPPVKQMLIKQMLIKQMLIKQMLIKQMLIWNLWPPHFWYFG